MRDSVSLQTYLQFFSLLFIRFKWKISYCCLIFCRIMTYKTIHVIPTLKVILVHYIINTSPTVQNTELID